MEMQERLKKATEDSERMHAENYPKTPDANTPPLEGAPPAPPDSQPPTPPPPPDQSATPPVTPPPPEDFKHKYEVLQGKYTKEMGDARRAIDAANAMAAKAMSEVAEIKIQLSQSVKAETPATQTPTPKPEETPAKVRAFEGIYPDMYQDGFVETVEHIATRVFNRMSNGKPDTSLAARIEQLEQRLVSKAETDFSTELTKSVPEWRQINQDPIFWNYLQENHDIRTGLPLWDLLVAAKQRGDVQAAASILDEFKKLKGWAPPAPETPPANPNPPASQPNLAPPKPSTVSMTIEGHPAGANAQPKIYTGDEVRLFYQDCVKGVYRGREPERLAIEADINLASKEGRILGR